MVNQKAYSVFGAVMLAFCTPAINSANGQRSDLSKSTKPDEETVKLSARYYIEEGTEKGFLIVKAEIPDGCYVYSLKQTAPLIPSKIAIQSDKRIVKSAEFTADKKPKVIERDPLLETRLEKHTGTVQFYSAIETSGVADFKSFNPEIRYSGQMCSDQGFCRPIRNLAAKAKFAGFFQRLPKTGPTKLKGK